MNRLTAILAFLRNLPAEFLAWLPVAILYSGPLIGAAATGHWLGWWSLLVGAVVWLLAVGVLDLIGYWDDGE